jgi:DNA-binding response OmpR family regulator
MPAHPETRVLVADSDFALRQALFARLGELNMFADCVANVTDALAKVADTDYAVAIIDVALPGGDIAELIQRVAEMPRASRPIVFVLAAHIEAARSLDVEIVQIVLRKPVRITHLVDLVRNCLRPGDVRDARGARKSDGDTDTQKTS